VLPLLIRWIFWQHGDGFDGKPFKSVRKGRLILT
jgi:hypothetical protein